MCIEVTVTTEIIASGMAQFKGEVYLRNKTSVSVFYRGNKLWVLVLVRVIKSYATILIPIIYFCDKTRVQMFYFDSNTTVPLQCAALVFWKVYVDRI